MEFPKPDEWYDFDRNLACFWELDEKTRVWWEIRGDTLDDQFHGDNNDKPEVFRADKQAIEDIARRNILLPTRSPLRPLRGPRVTPDRCITPTSTT